MQTSVAGIYAIGECAEHRGVCYGLVEPCYEQARVVAAAMAGEPVRYAGSVLATNLKVSGVSVFSAGDFEGVGAESIVVRDAGKAPTASWWCARSAWRAWCWWAIRPRPCGTRT